MGEVYMAATTEVTRGLLTPCDFMSSFYSHHSSPFTLNDDTLLVTLIGYSLEDSWKTHRLYGHKSFVKLFYQGMMWVSFAAPQAESGGRMMQCC